MNVGSTDRAVDVFIAGAGPAGLACAIAAAGQGFHVEVADGRKPPIDKACGEGLMPDTLAALAQLGIHLDHPSTQEILQASSYPLRGIRFIGSSHTSEATFPNGDGRGLPRPVLHHLLFDRALALGVRFHWQTVVKGIHGHQVHTSKETFHTRWIVGADGHQSRIRTIANLEKASTGPRRIASRQHFSIAPWTDFVEVYWTNHAQAYVTPVSPTEVCVAFIASSKFAGIQHALRLFPSLQHRLALAHPSDKPRGAITMSRRLRHVTSGNIALIGDASGSVDAITGEGLALCFRQAFELAHALRAEDLTQYERAHARLHRLPHFMSRTMLLMDRSPALMTRALTTLQRKPDLFSHLLQIHIGQARPRLMGATGILASLLCLLTS
ncbi:MAG TPA: NAD(P)/FAD-dependent oxidoreductase [Edaphobacter sp.]|nr:NAD(P)/FAD-dependent oxidoreductase [Edaphobacter sp.]